MQHPSALVLLPTFAAFVIFLVLCYRCDRASFHEGPNMALALLCALSMVSYVAMVVIGVFPGYVTASYGALGLLLFAGALAEMTFFRGV